MVPPHGGGSASRHQRLALTLQNKATVSFWFLQQGHIGLRFGLRSEPWACATYTLGDTVYEPDLRLDSGYRQPVPSACLAQA